MKMLDLFRQRLAAALVAGTVSVGAVAGGSTVDVWVELTERPPAPEASASAATRQRERIAEQQHRVREALSRLGALELARTRVQGNAIAVRVDRRRLDEVRAIDGVKRVRPARSMHPPETGGST